MSTTKTTTNQYNQQGMQNYNAYQGALNPILSGYAQNPFGNPFYRLNLANNMAQANQAGMNMNQNALSQFNMTGMGGAPSGARTQLMTSLGRYGSSLNQGAFMGAAQNAFANQWNAIGQMNAFQPLQTGQTQKTGGLGSWLPQVAGIAAGAALAPFTGGMSMVGAMGNLGAGALNGAMNQGPGSQPFFGGSGYWSPGYQTPNIPALNWGNSGSASAFGNYLPQGIGGWNTGMPLPGMTG